MDIHHYRYYAKCFILIINYYSVTSCLLDRNVANSQYYFESSLLHIYATRNNSEMWP